MKYRSRTEIVSIVLEAANGGATKTKIMYKAFLGFKPLKMHNEIGELLQSPIRESRIE
jgi:predicted transcriptional regulator